MLKKNIILSLFFIPIIITGICLALWQSKRSEWKQELLSQYENHIYQEPSELPTVILRLKGDATSIDSHLLKEFNLKPIKLLGTFITDLVYYRPNGKGIDLITGFKTDIGITPINVGTMPYAAKDIEISKILPLKKEVIITGFYRYPTSYASTLPKNKALVSKIPYATFFYKYQEQTLPGAIQVDNKTHISDYLKGRSADYFIENIPNNHIQYMWTWFILAGIATIIYILLLRQNTQRR